MANKYQHFEDVVNLGMTAYGDNVTLGDGTQGFALQQIAEDSPLTTRLGFMSGDVIISVNGLSAQRESARQLYEQLKNQRTFDVVFQRDGQTMSRSFNIGGR
jgi:type II secretory pathway component PulC